MATSMPTAPKCTISRRSSFPVKANSPWWISRLDRGGYEVRNASAMATTTVERRE
ncbi:hypothetical protein TIFTF001_004287 [Ficus carica]|uniref:Uncharacterized protein n=1 Tax=Ficus carica TaxID=3494 RepID=A0AA87ZX88_FICCA|nr:hypothetical protein TIFTF001_004287 [Ficus carica]